MLHFPIKQVGVIVCRWNPADRANPRNEKKNNATSPFSYIACCSSNYVDFKTFLNQLNNIRLQNTADQSGRLFTLNTRARTNFTVQLCFYFTRLYHNTTIVSRVEKPLAQKKKLTVRCLRQMNYARLKFRSKAMNSKHNMDTK